MRTLVSLFSFLYLFPSGCSCAPTLKKHQWKNRVLVLNTAKATAWRQQKELFDGSPAENTQRDLILLLAKPEDSALRKTLEFGQERFEMVLLGKDGRIKQRYHGVTPMKSIYDVIDAMPMRQREMRSKER